MSWKAANPTPSLLQAGGHDWRDYVHPAEKRLKEHREKVALDLSQCPIGKTVVRCIVKGEPGQNVDADLPLNEGCMWGQMCNGAQKKIAEMELQPRVPPPPSREAEFISGFLGVTQIGNGKTLRPLISNAVCFGSGSFSVDRSAWMLAAYAKEAQVGPIAIPRWVHPAFRGLFEKIETAQLFDGLVKLHPPRPLDEVSIAFGVVAAPGDIAGVLVAAEARKQPGGYVWCYVPPANLYGGARVIIGDSLGDVLEMLLDGDANEAEMPYFLIDGYRAPGVWISPNEQHWMRGEGYVNIGEAGVGWVLDDPSVMEVGGGSDEGGSDDSDYSMFDPSPYTLKM